MLPTLITQALLAQAVQETSATEVLKEMLVLPPPFNMVVLIVLLIAISGMVTTIVKSGFRFAERRAAERFKLELVQNGLSLEEAQQWVALDVKKSNKKS